MDSKAALIEALYAATGRGDWETAEAHLTEDFVAREADSVPFAGEYRGKGGLRELYAKVMAMMDVEALEVVQTTTGGDYAFSLVEIVLGRPAGVRVQLAEMFRFRDGRVCEIKPFYFDPAPVVAAVKAKAVAG